MRGDEEPTNYATLTVFLLV